METRWSTRIFPTVEWGDFLIRSVPSVRPVNPSYADLTGGQTQGGKRGEVGHATLQEGPDLYTVQRGRDGAADKPTATGFIHTVIFRVLFNADV